jgi:hypothetical protein
MKKVLYFIMFALIAGTLAISCGTSGAPVGAEGVPRPDWVGKSPRPTADEIFFVGYGRDGQTVTAKRQSARAAGLQALADWKDSTVSASLRDYVQEAGETGTTQSIEFLENAILNRAKANTSGFREVESWVNQDGQYVILFSYPKNDLVNDFKAAVTAFERNESAAYAEFKADEAFRILERNLE